MYKKLKSPRFGPSSRARNGDFHLFSFTTSQKTLQVAVDQFIIGFFRTTFNIISEPVSSIHRFYLDFPSEKQPLCSSFCEGCESKKVEFAGKARASRAREKTNTVCDALREVGRNLLFVAFVRSFTDC